MSIIIQKKKIAREISHSHLKTIIIILLNKYNSLNKLNSIKFEYLI